MERIDLCYTNTTIFLKCFQDVQSLNDLQKSFARKHCLGHLLELKDFSVSVPLLNWIFYYLNGRDFSHTSFHIRVVLPSD